MSAQCLHRDLQLLGTVKSKRVKCMAAPWRSSSYLDTLYALRGLKSSKSFCLNLQICDCSLAALKEGKKT